ncbi:MAG TPA: L,D-transpeptidase family protein [Gemmatimonadaceae bacterium]|nr:L,D-transpeptidase family protein [Gemmatimonadaceae bacterium]
MTRGRGHALAITWAAVAALVGACTIEDASEKRAADSAAAATANGAVQTSPGTVATPQPGSPGAAATQPSPMPGAPGDSAVPATPGAGNLSPDSVDVGRTSKATLLPLASTRVEVDLAARQLYVYDGDKRVGSYRVAVGSKEWPTQSGEWSITQVVWNPEWNPPKDESWAEQKDPKKPGAPDNPLGRAQLVYDPPRTIHGTNEPQSIGKAVSHGSIRLSNADVTKVARQLMEVTGVQKDDAFFRQVQQNRTEKVVVDLPQRVAIRVY